MKLATCAELQKKKISQFPDSAKCGAELQGMALQRLSSCP